MRVSGFLLVVLVLLGGVSVAEMPEETFGRGNDAYERRDHDPAALAYRIILEYRIEDPRVEYNLANAEFKRGRLGHAILHYERARRLAEPGGR